MSEFFDIIFGIGFTTPQLMAYLFFFIIGYIIYGLNETSARDKSSSRTPEKWSWKFWFKDNLRRYFTTLLCSYVLFRFYTDMSGHPFGYFDALSLGLIGDGIAATLKKRMKVVGGNRDNLTTKIKEEQGELG